MKELHGQVVRKVVGQGSKSEHAAVVLVSDSGHFVLRRNGGNAFMDPELDQLVGKRICGAGSIAGATFIMDEWKEE
jgi:hypothetical protein